MPPLPSFLWKERRSGMLGPQGLPPSLSLLFILLIEKKMRVSGRGPEAKKEKYFFLSSLSSPFIFSLFLLPNKRWVKDEERSGRGERGPSRPQAVGPLSFVSSFLSSLFSFLYIREERRETEKNKRQKVGHSQIFLWRILHSYGQSLYKETQKVKDCP